MPFTVAYLDIATPAGAAAYYAGRGQYARWREQMDLQRAQFLANLAAQATQRKLRERELGLRERELEARIRLPYDEMRWKERMFEREQAAKQRMMELEFDLQQAAAEGDLERQLEYQRRLAEERWEFERAHRLEKWGWTLEELQDRAELELKMELERRRKMQQLQDEMLQQRIQTIMQDPTLTDEQKAQAVRALRLSAVGLTPQLIQEPPRAETVYHEVVFPDGSTERIPLIKHPDGTLEVIRGYNEILRNKHDARRRVWELQQEQKQQEAEYRQKMEQLRLKQEARIKERAVQEATRVVLKMVESGTVTPEQAGSMIANIAKKIETGLGLGTERPGAGQEETEGAPAPPEERPEQVLERGLTPPSKEELVQWLGDRMKAEALWSALIQWRKTGSTQDYQRVVELYNQLTEAQQRAFARWLAPYVVDALSWGAR